MLNMSGGLSPAVRRCALLLAGAGSAVFALAAPMSSGAAPLVGLVATTTCMPPATQVAGHGIPAEACEATLVVTPSTTPGLQKVDAAVQCAAAIDPAGLSGVDETGVECSVVGADGIGYFDQTVFTPLYEPAAIDHQLTGLPPQLYKVCVQGEYLKDGSTTGGGLWCNTSNAVIRP